MRYYAGSASSKEQVLTVRIRGGEIMEAYTIIEILNACNNMAVGVFTSIAPDETMITDVYAFNPTKGYQILRLS